MNEINYKLKCEEYEQRMGIGEDDPAKEGYLVLVNILRQQNEFLRDFSIKSKIVAEDKGDAALYKNAKDLWEGLPSMIKSVSALRVELRMDGEDKKSSYKPITAKEIANGNV